MQQYITCMHLTKVLQNTRGKYGLIRKGDKATIIIGYFKTSFQHYRRTQSSCIVASMEPFAN